VPSIFHLNYTVWHCIMVYLAPALQKRIQLPLYLVGFKRIYKRPAQMKKNTSALFTPIGPVSCQRTGSFSHPRSFLLQNQKQLTSSITTHMKGFLLSLVAIAALALSSFGQSPEGFKYQAVVRDAGNLILSSQAVGMQLTIQQGSIGGTAVYTETFAPTTNAYGLVNLEIGSGTSADDFSTIDWANGPYFMETAVDVTGGTSYSVMGTSQLMSVPYALYANTSGNGAGPAGPAGNDGATGATGMQGADGIGIAQTLLISGDTLFISSGNYIVLPSSAPTLLGCTDSTALNYNSLANTDDGSCIAVVNGCTDATATNYDASANTDDGSCAYPPFSGAIGDTHQGGIVFYLDGNGGGLIAAPTDQSTGAEWGCSGTNISGADGTAIGTGAQNTIDIEAGCTTPGTAADICANLTLGGYSDWFLPSQDELNEMYLNIGQGNVLGLGNVGGFANYYYWSSTEGAPNNAWVQGFYDGYQYNTNKSTTYIVRAVRAF
jgi:hypothetical protein